LLSPLFVSPVGQFCSLVKLTPVPPSSLANGSVRLIGSGRFHAKKSDPGGFSIIVAQRLRSRARFAISDDGPSPGAPLHFASGGRSPDLVPKISRLRAMPWIQRCPRLAASASKAAGRPIARRSPPRLVWKLATTFSQPSPLTPSCCRIGGSSAGIRPTFPALTRWSVHSSSSRYWVKVVFR